MMIEAQVVRLAVLREAALRKTGIGYAPLQVDGYSFEKVQTALRHLMRRGLIDGTEIMASGSLPREIKVSGLTDEGRRYLRDLT